MNERNKIFNFNEYQGVGHFEYCSLFSVDTSCYQDKLLILDLLRMYMMFQERRFKMSKVITEAFASYFAGFALSVSVLLLLFYYLDKILTYIIHVYILENISVLKSENTVERTSLQQGELMNVELQAVVAVLLQFYYS